jgi:lactoylglutathione lyase
MGFCWATIQVADLDRSIAFYRDVVGLPLKRRFAGGGGGMELAFLGDGPTQVELICVTGRRTAGRVEGITLGFTVDSLEDQMALSTSKGFPVDRGPLSPNPSMRFFYVRDPDGVEVQFVQYLVAAG